MFKNKWFKIGKALLTSKITEIATKSFKSKVGIN